LLVEMGEGEGGMGEDMGDDIVDMEGMEGMERGLGRVGEAVGASERE
jgi:hypothetical protein